MAGPGCCHRHVGLMSKQVMSSLLPRGGVIITDQGWCHYYYPGVVSSLLIRGYVITTTKGWCHHDWSGVMSLLLPRGGVITTDQGWFYHHYYTGVVITTMQGWCHHYLAVITTKQALCHHYPIRNLSSWHRWEWLEIVDYGRSSLEMPMKMII